MHLKMDGQVLYFAIAFLSVLLILIVIKTILFFKSTRKRALRRWFYFNKIEIIDTGSNRTTKLRELQNRLSITLLILFILFGITFLLMVKNG